MSLLLILAFLAGPMVVSGKAQTACGEESALIEPVHLCGVTTVDSDSAGAIDVYLPTAVDIANPWFGGNDVQIRGEGRFIGFALIRYPLVQNSEIYFGGRLPGSAGSRVFMEQAGFSQDLTPSSQSFHLESGTYRLILLPDGGPVSLELRLEELQGALELRTQRPASYELDFPAPEVATPSPAAVHYSARAHGALQSQGLIWDMAWFSSDAHVASRFDTCFFDRTIALTPADPATYGPGCGVWSTVSPVQADNGIRSASSGGSNPVTTTPDELSLFYSSWDTTAVFGLDSEPAGPYTAQMALESAHVDGSVHSLAAFISFES